VSTHILTVARVADAHREVYGSAIITAIVSAVFFALVYGIRREMLLEETKSERQSLEQFCVGGTVHSFPEANGDQETGGDGDDYDEERSIPGVGEDNGNGEFSHQRKTGTWNEILGVQPNASREEINAAWRAKLKKNHPDRVADLDPDFQALAEERAKMVNAAREEGLRKC